MATAKAKTAAKPEAKSGTLQYPKNGTALGVLSFPLWNESDIDALAKWRQEKNIKPGQYPDRIGGSLFITQAEVDRVQKYLVEVFVPFTVEQYAHTNGTKGFSPEVAEALIELINAEDWTETNLPIRDLSDKDLENLGEDTDFVAKLVFSGSQGNEIQKKALTREDPDNPKSSLVVIDLDSVPGIGDPDRLWWGARNWFKGAFNMNAYTREVQVGKQKVLVHGISAYSRFLYLRTDLEMNFGGGNDDEQVLEEDFED